MTASVWAVLAALVVILLLFGLSAFLRWARVTSSFQLSDIRFAPGETVRGVLELDRRPRETLVSCELHRGNGGHPVRSVEARVDSVEPARSGWRCLVSAVLPEDARPAFEGEWTLRVEVKTENGGQAIEKAAIELRPFFVYPLGPVGPNVTVQARLETSERPPDLAAALKLYREDTDGPVRSVSGRVSSPVETPFGWRSVVEAVMPADARWEFETQWILWVGDASGGAERQVDEEEPVDLRAQ